MPHAISLTPCRVTAAFPPCLLRKDLYDGGKLSCFNMYADLKILYIQLKRSFKKNENHIFSAYCYQRLDHIMKSDLQYIIMPSYGRYKSVTKPPTTWTKCSTYHTLPISKKIEIYSKSSMHINWTRIAHVIDKIIKYS